MTVEQIKNELVNNPLLMSIMSEVRTESPEVIHILINVLKAKRSDSCYLCR